MRHTDEAFPNYADYEPAVCSKCKANIRTLEEILGDICKECKTKEKEDGKEKL